jgi:2-keto-4-pentenoate hydratase/2-oxohepta-3-ene-1,7-dioic acid hydratase in catechol pathway
MADLRAHFGLRAKVTARFRFASKNRCAISWESFRNDCPQITQIYTDSLKLPFSICENLRNLRISIRTFGGFRSGDEFFYGELRGDEVHRLAQPYWIQIQPTGEVLPLANLQIGIPVAPSKLIAVGLNYSDHIAEMKRTAVGAPLIWFKAPSSLLPHNGAIEIAFPEHRTDFEAELAVVLGTPTKNVSMDEALDHVFGYTIGLDITDRDLQKQEKQFGRCKSFDTYTPIGPYVHTDVDVSDVSLELRQNGELRQSTRTNGMIYSVADLVSFASQSLTLLPGDVILSGTPAGVGPIHAGDELEAAIDNWPRLRNSVAIAPDAVSREGNQTVRQRVEKLALHPASRDITK